MSKLMFVSDIHGSDHYFTKITNIIDQEQPDQICLLGDLLYHGPRNPLPEGYNPKAVLAKLNTYKDRIVAIRGNCDAEVDQMVLDFPMMADYTILYDGKRKIFMTHGHLIKPDDIDLLNVGDCFISGHTHVPKGEVKDGIHYLNPGSISLPKEETAHAYGIIEDDEFRVISLNGEIVLSHQL